MTTIEIIEYLQAMNKAEITESYIKNNSDVTLWFSNDENVFHLKPNEMLYFE